MASATSATNTSAPSGFAWKNERADTRSRARDLLEDRSAAAGSQPSWPTSRTDGPRSAPAALGLSTASSSAGAGPRSATRPEWPRRSSQRSGGGPAEGGRQGNCPPPRGRWPGSGGSWGVLQPPGAGWCGSQRRGVPGRGTPRARSAGPLGAMPPRPPMPSAGVGQRSRCAASRSPHTRAATCGQGGGTRSGEASTTALS